MASTSETENQLKQTEQSLSLHTLSAIRSRILNPTTPTRTVLWIFQVLTDSPQLTHHTLNLISELATHHLSFSQLTRDLILSETESPTRLAIEALASISEPEGLELEDERFASLCFGPSVPARCWMLRNAGSRVRVRPSLLLIVLLGFSKDPYPYVREAALEGLVNLNQKTEFEDVSLMRGCYQRGVQLLHDMEECVRLSAVRMVASWGLTLAASNADMKIYWSNDVFAKLCSMARDMSMRVRVEAFNGLAKMEMVSEDLLLQCLSKRVSRKHRETSDQFKMLATSVAGALAHGLEDEYFEVRNSACLSLRTLAIISVDFAHEALNWLLDMLTDDAAVVRLQAIETMRHMAINGRLKLQDKNLHMFLGALMDDSGEVRYEKRKILKMVKLNNLALFKSSIDGLLQNLDRYPQDEADVFSAFSHLGRKHTKFVGLIINGTFGEVEEAFEVNREFNSSRIAALLVLYISAPLLNADIDIMPPVMFAYAVTYLGRIHHAFSDVMDRDALFAYLCEKSKSTGNSVTNINLWEREQQLPSFEGDAPNFASNEVIESHIMREPKEVASVQVEQRQSDYDEVINFTNRILAKLPDMWSMIQSGCMNEVLISLRSLKEFLGSCDALEFTLLYLQIIKLLAEVWEEHLLPEKRISSNEIEELEFKLGKLDERVKELMSRFVGFSAEEELNIVELMLVTYVLRLFKVETCYLNLTFKRLTAIYSRVESILKERSTSKSKFVHELGNLIRESSIWNHGASYSPLQCDKCLKLFSLKLFALKGTIKQIKAKLSFPKNDSEHPFPFVSGLPVGIPCEITLHNISNGTRLWLKISTKDDLIQYVFLDLDHFGGSGEVRNFAFVAPFYRTPKVDSCTLKVCVGLECWFGNVSPVQRYGGPKHELVLLCEEKEVYLSKANRH